MRLSDSSLVHVYGTYTLLKMFLDVSTVPCARLSGYNRGLYVIGHCRLESTGHIHAPQSHLSWPNLIALFQIQ